MAKNKKRKKISLKEKERREKQSKIWHKITHPNEEYINAEKKRKENYLEMINSKDEKINILN